MKPTVIAFILAACFYSCASPDKKPAIAADDKKKDSVPVATDTSVAQAQPQTQQSNTTFFLNQERLTIPPYGLEKVKTLTAHVKYVEDGEQGTDSLDQRVYDSLSLREKFTYHMVHPESYSQNCDGLPAHPDEANRIYGYLPDIYGEFDWSEKQLAFLKNNRDSVDAMMKELIVKEGRVGENFREAIVEMNATEMIPTLIDFARTETEDHYTLTTLMLLMGRNKFPEFMSSSSYQKLYDREEGERVAYLVYNKANEELIIQRATHFYNGLSSK
ncbi:MAG TPA: hypothetical protein VNW04_08090 [Puia sp.]|nr:hypothetical protein [Puia sp.]